ncbi:hypothetical protein H4R33_004815, partial [Dimargaris cristalligena]
FDIEEYLNFDDTDDAQYTNPASSPITSTPNQQLNPPNLSENSELTRVRNSSTGEAGDEVSGDVTSAQLGTFDLGALDPATRLNLSRYIVLLRNSPRPALPNPKRHKMNPASSTAAINLPEYQVNILDVGQPFTSMSRTLEQVNRSAATDSKAESVYISKAKGEKQEIKAIIDDPEFMFKYTLGLCSQKYLRFSLNTIQILGRFFVDQLPAEPSPHTSIPESNTPLFIDLHLSSTF